MFSSTVIPTIGRRTLSRAVCSVLDQSFSNDEFEIIVVNDTGVPLPELEWQFSHKVRVIDTICHERSVARNTAAAMARGRYLHFLDDDDYLLPNALSAFWNISQSAPDAVSIIGGYQAIDLDDKFVSEFHPEMSGNIFANLVAGEGIPLGASFFRSEIFFKAGMFDPNHIGDEVRDLGRRIAFEGNVAESQAVVARIRVGECGSTTDWSKLIENDRWGREKALRLQNALARLLVSARTSYWRGRVSRAYFASSLWNLKRGNFFIASSRALSGLSLSGRHIFSSGYWRGLRFKSKCL